ncbi:hypothetical protein B4086_5594 [Bacillus cereus]|nr:hypothetical protein B4086_5594 [Bacillus cereus]
MGKGMTGWLSPEGVFHPCEYGEHSELANETVWGSETLRKERARITYEQGSVAHEQEVLKELLWIPMGIPRWGSQENMDYLFVSYKGSTAEQDKWLKENYQELSEPQQKMLNEHYEDMKIVQEIQKKREERRKVHNG